MKQIIDDEKDINDEIFLIYFKYQSPLLLLKDLISTKQDKNQKSVNDINDGLIDLKNAVNRKKIHDNENPKKIVNIIEKILFNKTTKR